MATAATAKDSGDSSFKCPICLDIFEDPIEIPCGHSFCNDCIMSCLSKVSASQCPVCRTSFTTKQMTDSRRLMRRMDCTNEMCSKCNSLVALSSLKNHRKVCSTVAGSKPPQRSRPMGATSWIAPKTPNRSTFDCPYCGEQNLDRESLLVHVNKAHALDTQQVVCPVCVAMPWGDPNLKSTDFKQHLNIRHKFDYDTYVDFQDDEDEILQSVLQKSISDM